MRLLHNRWPFLALLTVLTAVSFWAGRYSLPNDVPTAFGFVFLGALIAYAAGIVQEQRRETADAILARRRDLDETRRLAYMALIARSTTHPELVATVGNALAHHSLRVPFEEAAVHLAALVDGPHAERLTVDSEQWLRNLIYRITNELDDEPAQ